MPDRIVRPNPKAFHGIEDPIVRDHLRKIWDYVNASTGRTGDQRLATAQDLAALKRALPKEERRHAGYRATTLGADPPPPSEGTVTTGGDAEGVDATYVLVSHDTRLPNRRKLTAGTGFYFEDGGPLSTLGVRSEVVDAMGNRFARWVIGDFSGGLGSFGMTMASPGISGAYAQTRLGQMPRVYWRTAPGANSIQNGRVTTSPAGDYFWRGSGGLGGFYVRIVFGIEATNATMKWGIGMRVGAAANILAATVLTDLTDVVMVGGEAGDTEVSLMHNDSTLTCTKVPLGASFPFSAGEPYALEIYCDASASGITWALTSLPGGATTGGTLTTEIPAATAVMAPFLYACNGATATAVGISLAFIGADFPYLPEEA
jgi:hypothetical protein